MTAEGITESSTTSVRALLSADEIRQLTRRSDARGAWAIASTWAIVFATFWALARWPHPVTFVLAVVVLGGRQLALAILMHEAAHRTLFERTFLNDVVSDWLCARPIWNDVARYKRHHLKHHAHTGTELDPDLGLVTPFPTTRRSLVRKFARDLFGPTALKRIVGQVLIASEVLEYTVSTNVKRLPGKRNVGARLVPFLRNTAPFLLTNAVLVALLALAGHAWVYWAWIAANLTTFNLFVRIRSMAEHACTKASDNTFENTRTTRAGFLARITVAPIRVNYHLEHHLLVAVPYFRLPDFHRALLGRGAVEPAESYADVLRIVSRAA